MKSKSLFQTLMILSGVVVGTLVGNLTKNVDFLKWLSYGIRFGTDGTVGLDLGVLDVSFGISINLTISCIIFIVIAMIIAKKVK